MLNFWILKCTYLSHFNYAYVGGYGMWMQVPMVAEASHYPGNGILNVCETVKKLGCFAKTLCALHR